MILFFVLYEAGFIALHKWARENNPEMTLWVIMGSKVCKIIAAGIMLVFVRLLTDEPLVRFGIIMLVVLLLSVLIESAYCLRNRVK